MSEALVCAQNPVCLVGGGELSIKDLEDVERFAPTIVAADGGAAHVLASGRHPVAVIGDFDSLDDATRRRIPAERLHHIPEQESTDFDKALRRISAPLVVGLGFLGARIDHQLAALNTLVRHADRACVLVGALDVIISLPPRLSLNLLPGTPVSIFPMAAVTGRSEGLQWPIDGLHFAPDGRSGTSNRATGPVTIEMHDPGAIGLFPRSTLEAVTRALLRADATRWPARA